jgi:hypothetical protein
MRLLLLLLTLIPNFDLPKNSNASCPRRVPEAACVDFWRHEFVFSATVLRTKPKPYERSGTVDYPLPDYQQYAGLTATLKVDEIFRGSLSAEVTIEMGDCYFPFEPGRSYLVYADKRDGKLLQRRGISRTLPLSDAKEDLVYIRSLPTASPAGRIFGKVHESSPDGNLLLERSSFPMSRPSPGVKVVAESNGKTFETLTAEDGSYELSGLPPGKYGVRLDIATHLEAENRSAELNAKACQPVSFWIRPKGSISGRLIDDAGKPVANAILSIFLTTGVTEQLIEKAESHRLMRHQTDENGSFAFDRLPGGEYFLAVNLVEGERTKNNGASGHPRIFYPGVTNVSSANPIILGPGKAVKNVEITLPPRPR